MTGRLRLNNGRFVKEKVLQKKNNFLKIMNDGKRKKEEKQDNSSSVDNSVSDGNRIVNLKSLATNLKCSYCKEVLSLENIIDETLEGLHSILKVDCLKCGVRNVVPTSPKVQCNSGARSSVNLSAILGAISSGTGCDGLNKILNCIDIPIISKTLYKRYEREIGPAIEKAAKESCGKAAHEERQLVIENVKKLCDTL